MKIFYEQVDEEGLDVERSFSFEEGIDKFEIVSFIGRVDKAGDAYVLTGKLEATLTCPCDRCIEEFATVFHEDLAMTLSPLGDYPAPSKETEEGLTDEEAGMYVTPKDCFVLDDVLREEVLLLTPIKRLCKDDCKGICPDCGALLNKEACKCAQKVDPRWSALLGKDKKNI